MSKNYNEDWQGKPTQRLSNENSVKPQRQDTTRFSDQSAPAANGPDPREPGKAQARTLICSECGGEMLWASTDADQTRPLRVYPYMRMAAWGRNSSNVIALVCTDCGFTKLYTMEPRKMLE